MISSMRITSFTKSILHNKSLWKVVPISKNCKAISTSQTFKNQSKKKIDVTFIINGGQKVQAEGIPGETILDTMKTKNLNFSRSVGNCGGSMGCGSCQVILDEESFNKMSPPSYEEIDVIYLATETTNRYKIYCISLAGCGFLGNYLIGALACLKENVPDVVDNATLCGSSMGALIAAAEACQIPLSYMEEKIYSVAEVVRKQFLGSFSPFINIEDYIRETLQILPHDAHQLCSGRLVVSLTAVKGFNNILVNKWHSREDLISCLLCTCFIPVWSGFKMPTYHGVRCLDGGFSCNVPVIHKPAISISPFYDKCDISPKDSSHSNYFVKVANQDFCVNFENMKRFWQVFFPSSSRAFKYLYASGYTHAVNYLLDNSRLGKSR